MNPENPERLQKILLQAASLLLGISLTGLYMHAGNKALTRRWDEHRAVCPLLKPPTPGFSEGARFAQIALQNQPGITTHDQLFNVASNWWFEIDICKGTNIMRILAAQAALAQQQATQRPVLEAKGVTNVTSGVGTNNHESNPPAAPVKKVYKEYKEEKKVKAEVDGK